MSVLLIIKLKEIIYSGENIGDDLNFQFDVKGQITHVKTRISSGQHKSFGKVLFQETFVPAHNATHSVAGGEGSVSLPIGVNITEEDPVFHDTGSGSSIFNVQLQESEPQTHSFNANVIASGGDMQKTATFTFIMEANVDAIDVNLKDGATPVNENGYVYITAIPQMPRLTASLKPSKLSGNAKWRLHIEYKRSPRNDNEYYPGPTASTWKTLAASASWNIASEFGADFRGGKATLYCDYAGTQYQMVFHIRGENPTEAAAETEIGNTPWYVKPIAKWESNRSQQERYYAQFNTAGVLGPNPDDYQWCPNFGGPNGWGIMQLDTPNPEAQQLWNWKANISEGKAKLANPCRTEAEEWIARQEQQQQAEEPEKPLENYVFTFNGVNFQKGTVRTPIDACTIQRYRGAAHRVIFWKNKTATEPGSWEIREDSRQYVDNVCGEVN